MENAVQKALREAADTAAKTTGKTIAEPKVADTGALAAKSQSGNIS